jgi:DNA-binding GntR family transcriptional regulator
MESSTEIQAVSLVGAVSDAIRLMVINAELEPGTLLTEQRVAEQFGVARTTAKAAVERLVSTGFLERSIHKTARVPILELNDINDLFLSRIVIETDAVARLAQGGTLSRNVEEAASDVVRHAKSGNYDKMAAADVEFHSELVKAAGLVRLSRMHSMLMGEAHLCMVQVQRKVPADAEMSYAEHSAVIAAVKAGNSEEAAEHMRNHLIRTRDVLMLDHSRQHSESPARH